MPATAGPTDVAHERGVVVGLAEQADAPAVAGEHEGADDAAAPASRRRRSSSAESASRTWNCTVAPTSISSPTARAPTSGSAPRSVADEEVAPIGVERAVVDHPTEVQPGRGRAPGRAAVAASTTSCSLVERRRAGDLVEHRPLGPGDGERVADRPTALRHERGDRPLRPEQHADRAVGVHGAVERQPVGAGRRRPPRPRPPTTVSPGSWRAAASRNALERERRRVGQQQQRRARPAGRARAARGTRPGRRPVRPRLDGRPRRGSILDERSSLEPDAVAGAADRPTR